MSSLRERIEGLVASKRKLAEHVARVCTAESNQFRAGDIIAFCDDLAAALVAEGQGDAQLVTTTDIENALGYSWTGENYDYAQVAKQLNLKLAASPAGRAEEISKSDRKGEI